MSPPTEAEQLTPEDLRSQESAQESYERIPYRTNPWTSSQPVVLECRARLLGVAAAPADRCRVLELGCGDGGNIIPLAVAHPGSSFVGLDLAPVHVDAGSALAEALSLDNLRLEAGSFVDFQGDGEPFDYIIAHGLMSWVTPHLQELLFKACKRLLAPHGVAFISYNTYPGWYMQHSIRELLHHHSRGVDDTEVTLERSRKLLDVLIQTVPERESAYRDYLESIGAVARNPERKYYFAHEYLEDENHPFYVRDFIERAARHGLQYLADADLVDMELDNMPEQPARLLEELVEDRAHRLQVLDFAVNRKFRQSLLCHDTESVSDVPDFSRAAEMYVDSQLRPAEEAPDMEGPGAVGFSDRHGRTIEVDQPVVKAALSYFCEVRGQPIAFEELLDWARSRAGSRPAAGSEADRAERELLALILGRIHTAGMVGLQASPPCWALEAGEIPVASPLVRLCARRRERTTSLRHRAMALDNEAVCEVLQLLDGSRDRSALLSHFDGRVSEEELEKILQLAAQNAVLIR